MKPCYWRTLSAVGAVLLSPVSASASTESFQCMLAEEENITADSQFSTNTEKRLIQIQVDEAARRISIYQDGKPHALGNVTITQIAMTGYTDKLSVGLQKSSLNVVLQTYEPNRIKAEFGSCRNTKSDTSSIHQNP